MVLRGRRATPPPPPPPPAAAWWRHESRPRLPPYTLTAGARDLLARCTSGGRRALLSHAYCLAEIEALEPDLQELSDEELGRTTEVLRGELALGASERDLLPAAFAAVREAARRTLGVRLYDSQLVGGSILHTGGVAEMRTGEGKTLVAVLAAYLRSLRGLGCHVVTANSYLAKRDAAWVGKVYAALGATVGVVLEEDGTEEPAEARSGEAKAQEEGAGRAGGESAREGRGEGEAAHRTVSDEGASTPGAALTPSAAPAPLAPPTPPPGPLVTAGPDQARDALSRDVTYLTAHQLGFLWLADASARRAADLVLRRPPWSAVLDEVDAVLLDDARQNLILSSHATRRAARERALVARRYRVGAAVASRLRVAQVLDPAGTGEGGAVAGRLAEAFDAEAHPSRRTASLSRRGMTKALRELLSMGEVALARDIATGREVVLLGDGEVDAPGHARPAENAGTAAAAGADAEAASAAAVGTDAEAGAAAEGDWPPEEGGSMPSPGRRAGTPLRRALVLSVPPASDELPLPLPPPPRVLVFDPESSARELEAAGFEVLDPAQASDELVERAVVPALWGHPRAGFGKYVVRGLKALHVFREDVDYIVRGAAGGAREVLIVDQSTGRVRPSTRWSGGLHQALEAKHGLRVGEDRGEIASVNYASLFKLYGARLSGMTGTAWTQYDELKRAYGLRVVRVPPHRASRRIDAPGEVFAAAAHLERRLSSLVLESLARGQPVLVGTSSVEASERAHAAVARAVAFAAFGGGGGSPPIALPTPPHIAILNARPELVRREAQTIAQAGLPAAVTIATGMAGRGTDILLGGDAKGLTLLVMEALMGEAGEAGRRWRERRAGHAAGDTEAYGGRRRARLAPDGSAPALPEPAELATDPPPPPPPLPPHLAGVYSSPEAMRAAALPPALLGALDRVLRAASGAEGRGDNGAGDDVPPPPGAAPPPLPSPLSDSELEAALGAAEVARSHFLAAEATAGGIPAGPLDRLERAFAWASSQRPPTRPLAAFALVQWLWFDAQCARLAERVRVSGGLRVIVASLLPTRGELQLRGRAGRQGEPGETFALCSFDEPALAASSPGFALAQLRAASELTGGAALPRSCREHARGTQEAAERGQEEEREARQRADEVLGSHRSTVYRVRGAILRATPALERARAWRVAAGLAGLIVSWLAAAAAEGGRGGGGAPAPPPRGLGARLAALLGRAPLRDAPPSAPAPGGADPASRLVAGAARLLQAAVDGGDVAGELEALSAPRRPGAAGTDDGEGGEGASARASASWSLARFSASTASSLPFPAGLAARVDLDQSSGSLRVVFPPAFDDAWVGEATASLLRGEPLPVPEALAPFWPWDDLALAVAGGDPGPGGEARPPRPPRPPPLPAWARRVASADGWAELGLAVELQALDDLGELAEGLGEAATPGAAAASTEAVSRRLAEDSAADELLGIRGGRLARGAASRPAASDLPLAAERRSSRTLLAELTSFATSALVAARDRQHKAHTAFVFAGAAVAATGGRARWGRRGEPAGAGVGGGAGGDEAGGEGAGAEGAEAEGAGGEEVSARSRTSRSASLDARYERRLKLAAYEVAIQTAPRETLDAVDALWSAFLQDMKTLEAAANLRSFSHLTPEDELRLESEPLFEGVLAGIREALTASLFPPISAEHADVEPTLLLDPRVVQRASLIFASDEEIAEDVGLRAARA